MSDHSQRRQVFAALAASLSARPGPPAQLPAYKDSLCVSACRLPAASPWENFAANFRAVHGLPLRSPAALARFLRENQHLQGFCDPALLPELQPALESEGLVVHSRFDRHRIDDYAFGITRASGAIAESGSIILREEDTVDRLAALAPWVHVAVLRETDLARTLPEAIARLGSSRNVVWVTGPSKTADIEGILIEGVHGPGVQICLCPEVSQAETNSP